MKQYYFIIITVKCLLAMSSKAPSCMEGQDLDQQFLRFPKALLNQYKLVPAGTFYSWGAGVV